MNRKLVHVSLLVRDYDEAIQFYTRKLDFELVSDEQLSDTKRWVIVRPRGLESCGILLAKAQGPRQEKFIGDQTGGRVFLFLATDDFERDLENLVKNNVSIVRPPTDEPYGRVAVFEDLYGNKWDLIQYK